MNKSVLNEKCFMPIGPTTDRLTDPMASPGESEYGLFYTAYGECFSAWSSVELQLFCLYIFLLNSPEYKVASAAFYSMVGFRAKAEAVDAIAKNSGLIDEEDQKKWNEIYGNILKKQKTEIS